MSYTKQFGDSNKPAISETRNQENTLWIGGLDTQVTDTLLYELALQFAPVKSVYIPIDKISGTHSGYGFIEYYNMIDTQYAYNIMNNLKLYNKSLRINRAGKSHSNHTDNQLQQQSIYNSILFIGNLSDTCTDKLLHDTFIYFGNIVSIKIIHNDTDNNTNNYSGARSRSYAFITYDLFESCDRAIEAMNGQYLDDKQINVQYSFMKDNKSERHGSAEERLLERQRLQQQINIDNNTNIFNNNNTAQLSMQTQQQQALPTMSYAPPQSFIPPHQTIHSYTAPSQHIPYTNPQYQSHVPPPQQQQQQFPVPPSAQQPYTPYYPPPVPPGLQPQHPAAPVQYPPVK